MMDYSTIYVISAARDPRSVREIYGPVMANKALWITEQENKNSFGDDRVRYVDALWNYAQVEQAALRFAAEESVEAVVNPYETGAVAASIARKTLALPGPSHEQVLAFSNKYTMKRSAQRAGVPVTDFGLVADVDSLRDYMELWGQHVVIKPLVGGGSAGVKKIRSTDDIDELAASDFAQPLLVEKECDIAREYHVDCVVYADRSEFMVSQYLEPQLSTVKKRHGYFSMELADTEPHVNKLKALCKKLFAYLGVDRGVFHAEFFELSTGDLLFSEIGMRPAGGGIPQAFEISTGINAHHAHCTMHLQDGVFDSDISDVADAHPREDDWLIAHGALPTAGITEEQRQFLDDVANVFRIDVHPVSHNQNTAFLSATNGGFVFFRAKSRSELLHLARLIRDELYGAVYDDEYK